MEWRALRFFKLTIFMWIFIFNFSLSFWGSRHAKNLKLLVSLTLLSPCYHFLSEPVTYFPTFPLCQFLLSISITTLRQFANENKRISIYCLPLNSVPCNCCNFSPQVTRKLANFGWIFNFFTFTFCSKQHSQKETHAKL